MIKKPLYTDPHFTITDQAILTQFLRLAQVDPLHDHEDLILAKLCAAFAHIPYENLTKIIKADAVISSDSAKRLPMKCCEIICTLVPAAPVFMTAAFIAF
jgi:hypothetical protein